MAGLSDLMAYEPMSTGVGTGMKQGADIRQSQAAAGYSEAMANRMNQMLPYELDKERYEQQVRGFQDPAVMAQGPMGIAQQQQYAAKKAIEDYRRRPIEDQQNDRKLIQKQSDDFANNMAVQILATGSADAAAGILIAQDPNNEEIIKRLKAGNLWGHFTTANAEKRLKANPQFLQAQMQSQYGLQVADIKSAPEKFDTRAVKAIMGQYGVSEAEAIQRYILMKNPATVFKTPEGVPYAIEDRVPSGSVGQPQPGAAPAKTIQVNGVSYEVLKTNPDGSYKIKNPKTGQTGTYTP